MIPYDDLVAALQQWRARQGLPVSALGGGGSSAAPQTASGPQAQPGSGPYGQSSSSPYAQPGSGPARSAPPMPPPGKQPQMPPPLAAGDDMHEVDDAEMLEEQYDSDFAMSFGGQHENDERTIAGTSDDVGNNGRGNRDDW